MNLTAEEYSKYIELPGAKDGFSQRIFDSLDGEKLANAITAIRDAVAGKRKPITADEMEELGGIPEGAVY